MLVGILSGLCLLIVLLEVFAGGIPTLLLSIAASMSLGWFVARLRSRRLVGRA